MIRKILAGLLIGSSISAYAAGPVYVDGNLGVDTGNNNLAVNADAGYMFNRYVGAEGGFTISDNYNMFDGAVKGVLPLANIVDLYGKLGVGINNYSDSDSTVGLLYGGGVAFNVAKSWQLHVEDFTVTGSNPNFLMFGAQYSF